MIISIPNALTLLRALGIPIFIYCALVIEADGLALLTLVIGGATDYFDGKVARALNQESRFGEIADPLIDRLYIAATLIVLYLRQAIPLWVLVVLFARDAILALATLVMLGKGHPPLEVSFLGKAATFNLLYAFPFLLLALNSSFLGDVAFIFGWAFTLWGIALYMGTGVSYFQRIITTIKVISSHPSIESE